MTANPAAVSEALEEAREIVEAADAGRLFWTSAALTERFARALTSQARLLEESTHVIRALLDCPEIADCAPDDRDPETYEAERQARSLLSKLSPERGSGEQGSSLRADDGAPPKA